MPITTGPYKVKSFKYGSRIESLNGETLCWCGDLYDREPEPEPHQENAKLLAQSFEMYKLLDEAFKMNCVLDVEWNRKTVTILTSISIA